MKDYSVLSEEEKIKNLIKSVFLSTLYSFCESKNNDSLFRAVVNNPELVNSIVENVYESRIIQNLISRASFLLEQHQLDSIEKQIELEQLFIRLDLLPIIHESISNLIFSAEYLSSILTESNESISNLIDRIIKKILAKENPYDKSLINEIEDILNEDLVSVGTASSIMVLIPKIALIISVLTIITLVLLVFRVPGRIVISVSSALKRIGEYLKDIQKDNLTITEFFENIPPECLKEFSDIWPELKQPALDPYKFASEFDLTNYKQEVLDRLRKKLMRVDILRGIYDRVKIAKSKGTLCSVRYFISLTGVLLYTYYHCLAKNGNLRLLSDLLKIKADDIVTTDSDILDAFAEAVPNMCLAKYKDFKKVLKFSTQVIKTVYKELDPELYSKLMNELLQTISKAHKEGERLLRKMQPRDNNERDRDRRKQQPRDRKNDNDNNNERRFDKR